LYYWPGFAGRGEFVRLLFVETDTPFDEPWRENFKYPDSVNELR
jgi:hypothetical protein